MIAIYCRVSTTEQAENGHSLDEQSERLQNFCKAKGWDNYHIFTDAGFSGAKMQRPALQDLIREVKNHKIEAVLVYKLDRLSRSQKDTLTLIEDVFLANNCDFISMSENFDTSTPLGRAMIGILAVFAQLEREQIKERMMMGHEARAKQGRYKGSWRNPIGYDYIDQKLVINEFEAMQIVTAFEMYAQGFSFKKITKHFHDCGYVHKYGEWSVTSLQRCLNSRNYIGEIKFKGKWYKGAHEPIISEELWDKVQTLRFRNRELTRKNDTRSGIVNTYLAGFIYCARCGARYSKKINRCRGHQYPLYQCQSRFRKKTPACKDPNCQNKNWKIDELDNLVLSEIRKLKFEDLSPKQKTDDKSPVLLDQIKKLERQQSKLLDVYSVGDMPLDIVQSKMTALNEQIDILHQQLEKIENEANERLTKEDAMHMVSSLDDVLADGDLDEIRSIIGALIDRIDIDGENITIHWAFI